ncbi:MAG: FAD-dependent oxidoreductase [Verrucomicrobia bacterium]|nr:FAD-dependent oxidoreductase [Verrucomicrobiota bacterium]
MSVIRTGERPLKIAIVGSGPAGCFTARELLRSKTAVQITVLERLPVPYGLVRFGVAPDHPHTRRVTRVFDEVFRDERVNLRTGVTLGEDCSLERLRADFDVVVLATGAGEPVKLEIPGSELPQALTAMQVAGWFNGHPDFRAPGLTLDMESIAIVGNGNVALDIARMFGRSAEELSKTDISTEALSVLRNSRIRDIHIVGRGTLERSSFGERELREVCELFNCDPAEGRDSGTNALSGRTLHFRFLESPVRFTGDTLVLRKNRLAERAGDPVVEGTEEESSMNCGLLISSIGFEAAPIPGVPFNDERRVVPAVDHRVAPGVYAVGWVKTGAKGLIGHSKRDAASAVQAILTDL